MPRINIFAAMKNLNAFSVLAFLSLCLVLPPGCRKKPTTTENGVVLQKATPEAAATASKLNGASQVMTAINNKDYDAAVALLMQIQQTVASDEQKVQFLTLASEVKNKLLEAGATDPKAAEAANAVRRMTTLGR